MQVDVKKLPKSILELTITLGVDELQPYLDAAAIKIGTKKTIEGFRAGMAPRGVVEQKVGAMTVLEAAAEEAVRKTYSRALEQGKWVTLGAPEIAVTTLAPGNPFTYKATVTLLPEVEKLADYQTIRIPDHTSSVTPEQVDAALRDLQKMQTQETLVDREVRAGDKVVVDMKMFLDNVPVDGGDAKNHSIYLDEEYFIPGFKEKLTGIKKGETREFSLPFPKEHYRKQLAGREILFRVTATGVVELAPPPLDDAFAARLEQKTLSDLRALIKQNLEAEASQKEGDRVETEITKKLVEGSRFGDMPEILVNREADRMVLELEHAVIERGLEFTQYLTSIKKSAADLKLEFIPRAVERIKAAIIIREVARRENINPTDKEVADTIADHLSHYADDPKAQEEIHKPEYAELVRINLRNAKTMDFLKKIAAG